MLKLPTTYKKVFKKNNNNKNHKYIGIKNKRLENKTII